MKPRPAPWLVVLAVAALVGLGFGVRSFFSSQETRAARTAPRHVFLISLDTLRADHCGFMGYAKPTTPFLDELASRGVVFEQHFTHSNNTLTAHASILTGLHPLAHAVEHEPGEAGERRGLAPGFETIAEAFAAEGWATAAFTAHKAWLSGRFGLDQGFEVMDAAWRDAPAVGEAFVRWYEARAPARFFAFLHFFDAHSDVAARGAKLPYESTDELTAQFAGPPPPGFTGRREREPLAGCCTDWLRAVHEGREPLPDAHREHVAGLYDAGIAKLDRDLRAFFGRLEALGLLEDALVVITSDHGEELHDHGGMLHYAWTDEVLRVPLIVLAPGTAPRRVAGLTRAIDLAPTLADLARLNPPDEAFLHGRSLADALQGAVPANDGTVVLAAPGLRYDAAGNTGTSERTKLVDEPGEPAFYDLETDPGERANLHGHPGDPARAADDLRIRLRSITDQGARMRARALKNGGPFVPGAAELDTRRLRELGYL